MSASAACPAVAAPGAVPASPDGWHPVCLVSELPVGGTRCADVNGRPLALFRTAAPSASPAGGPDAAGAGGPASGGLRLSDGSSVFCLDRVCYHMGGPLELGDVEDLGGGWAGGPVLRCPWHSYRIALADGAGLYQQAPGQWKSKGVRQRVHAVRVVTLGSGAAEGSSSAGDESSTATLQLQVRVLADGAEVASDEYNAPAKYHALQERLKRSAQTVTLNTASWRPPQQQPHPYLQQPPGALRGAGGAAPGYVRSGHVFAANRAAAAAAAASGTSGRGPASSKGAGQ